MKIFNFNTIKGTLAKKDNIKELEESLKDQHFAVEINKTDHMIRAIIFDNFAICSGFCGHFPKSKYETMSFEQFKHTVGDNWHNPNCYHFKYDDEILFCCELIPKNANYQDHSDGILLSNESFQQLGKAICEEQIRRSTDKYGGLTLNKDALASVLENKYFGVSCDRCETKAAIFDSREKCEFFCELSSGFEVMTVEQFQQATKGKWENPNRYYVQRENWIIYIDGEM